MDKPAFPTSKRKAENYMDEGGYGRSRIVTVEEGGMTLREYAAVAAMQGLLGSPDYPHGFEALADDAVRQADALLARLEESK